MAINSKFSENKKGKSTEESIPLNSNIYSSFSMELLPLLAAYFVAISFMLAPTSSHQLNNVQKSLQKAAEHDHHAKLTILPSLPRKLQLNQEPNVMKRSPHINNSMVLPKESIEHSSSGTKSHEDEEEGKHGTWKEGLEDGPNKSDQYFSMDYTWVRKKRPIHN